MRNLNWTIGTVDASLSRVIIHFEERRWRDRPWKEPRSNKRVRRNRIAPSNIIVSLTKTNNVSRCNKFDYSTRKFKLKYWNIEAQLTRVTTVSDLLKSRRNRQILVRLNPKNLWSTANYRRIGDGMGLHVSKRSGKSLFHQWNFENFGREFERIRRN